MSDYSNADFLSRIERRKRQTRYFPSDEAEELKAKLVQVTNCAYHYASKKSAKQKRAEAGSKNLNRWLK